jgi:hypothetical protein
MTRSPNFHELSNYRPYLITNFCYINYKQLYLLIVCAVQRTDCTLSLQVPTYSCAPDATSTNSDALITDTENQS